MAGIKSSRLQFLFSLLFFQLFINSVQFPLSDCTIRGKITDSLTQRPLVQATIKIAGTTYGAISDTNGIYSIENIPRGIYSISVSLIGYKSIVRDNIRISGQITVENFSLYEIPTLISGVTIRPDNDRSELNEFTGSLRLDNSRLKRIPGNLEDVVRSVTILPGVSQLTNYYNDLVVKGGGPAENLFIIDGLEVANINHFGSQVNSGGVNSFINMDYVKSVDFSAGGFSSLYGDKISSVTEISLRNGNSDHLSGSAVLSATQFALNLEGPVFSNTDFIISARKSYLDMVFKAYGFTFAPQYHDLFARVNSRIDKRNNLTFIFFGVFDDVRFFDPGSNLIYENPRALGSKQTRYISGITYKNLFENGFFNVNLSRNMLLYQSISNLIFSNRTFEDINTFKLDLAVKLSQKSEIDIGLQAKLIKYSTDIRLSDYSTSYDERLQISGLKTANQYLKSAAYIQYNQVLGDKLKINVGLRSDFFDGTSEDYTVSPRSFTQYFFSAEESIALSFGIYNQTPEYLWIVGDEVNKNLKSISSRQVHLQYENKFSENYSIRTGSFLKKYSDYPVSVKRPYLVMANAGTGFSGTDDNFSAYGLEPLMSAGEGTIRGIELYLEKRPVSSPLWGIVSITYSRSELKGLDGIIRSGSFDQRWNLTITGGYIINEKWEAGVKFRFATGTPYTPFNASGKQDPFKYNSARLPEQHSLDIRIERRWNLTHWKIRAFLDIQNIYNHKVRTLIRWDKRENRIAEDPVLGIVPSIGISVGI